jgi:hypothetical protein
VRGQCFIGLAAGIGHQNILEPICEGPATAIGAGNAERCHIGLLFDGARSGFEFIERL